jgi:hypothetical protein
MEVLNKLLAVVLLLVLTQPAEGVAGILVTTAPPRPHLEKTGNAHAHHNRNSGASNYTTLYDTRQAINAMLIRTATAVANDAQIKTVAIPNEAATTSK